MVCPNINSPEWKRLENAVGKKNAYSIFINNGYDIPSNEVIDYLSMAKVTEKEINWIKRKLPEGMDMTIFEILAEQSSHGNQYVWGNFKNNVLRLSSLAQAGTGYHEYFHAIFRNYFPQEEIEAYYQLAANEIEALLEKNNKSIREYIAEKNSTFIESGLTTQDKVNLLYEEYLADQFAKYMKKKEYNNIFQKMFETLKNFINFIFNNQRSLDLLFHKMSNSDYRNQAVALNKFQEGYLQDSAYVRKIEKSPLVVSSDEVYVRTFGIEESQQIVRDIAKIYFNLKNSDYYSSRKFKPAALLNDAVNIMYQHALDSRSDLAYTLDPKKSRQGINDREYVIDSVRSFIKSVSPYFSFNEDKETDDQAQDIDENGDPLGNGDDRENVNPREDSFGKESAEKQGWSRLPQFLREYISTTSYLETDENGNPILMSSFRLPDGSILPIYKEKTIDVNKIYFGLTRSLIDTPNDISRLVKMYEISRSNTNQKAFVDRFFQDANLDMNRLNEMESTQSYISRRADGTFTLKDTTLIQAVLKGFDKYTQDPLMMAIDTVSRKSTVALANRNNASIIFFDHWKSDFEAQMFIGESFNQRAWDPVFKTKDVIVKSINPTAFISEADIKQKAKFIIDQLSRIGITLSEGFVEYSIADNLKAGGKLKDSPEALRLKAKLSRIKLPRENVLKQKTIDALFNSINVQGNPFETSEADNANDSIRTIQGIAKGNVKFDEAAYETSYIASDGTIRYGHQDATLHLIEVNKMSDVNYLQEVLTTGIRDAEKGTVINGKFHQTDKEDADFRKNSLFNQPQNGIRKLLNAGQDINFILRPADGLKEDYLGTNDEGQSRRMTFVKKGESEGVHFGDMTDRDYATYMLNLMLESYETQDIFDEQGVLKERVFFSPVSLGMMETSKTHHFLYLPVIRNLYTEKGITSEGINYLGHEIEKEYNRIRRVAQELQTGEGDQRRFITLDEAKAEQKKGNFPFIFSNYHFGKRRALDFTDFNSGFLTSDLMSALKEAAISDKPIDEFRGSIAEDLKNKFEEILNQHIDELVALGVITRDSKGKIDSELLSSNYFTNSKEESTDAKTKARMQAYGNIQNGFRANLAHVILQQHLNSLNALHIINGDPALMYKNDGAGTDFYKRMKTSNGAGVSASHSHNYLDKPNGFKRFKGLTLAEPNVSSKFTKNDKGDPDQIDVADAQMYMRAKTLKHVLLGFGKLNETIADLIVNKIEKGIPLTKEDLFDSGVVIEQDRFINPYKFIFRDPASTKKISAFILTQNLVSVNVGTEEEPDWRPAKDREELYDIYSLMEEKDVDLIEFETGSKTMTANVVGKDDKGKYDRESAFPISYSTDYLRLQLENPSNKTEVTLSTQLLQAIDTEQDLDSDGYIDGKKVKLGKVIDEYGKALSNKHNINYLIGRNTLYDIGSLSRDIEDSLKLGYITPKLVEFQNKAIKGLLESGADSQLVDFFRTTVDDNGNEVPQFDLNNPKTIEKYVNLWYSSLSKGIYSLKSKGFAAALVSSYGFTPIKKITQINEDGSIRWETVRKDSMEYKTIHEDDITINQITYSDEKTFKVLTIGNDTIENLRERLRNGETIHFKDRLQYGVPRYNTKGEITGYFAEVLFPNHHPELNDNTATIPDAVKYMFGNRIPLQDKHSMMNFEIVDYLPMEYGSSLVAPQEIVEFSGADYDIDKVYIITPPVYIENGEAFNYSLDADIDVKYQEYLRWMATEVKQIKKNINSNNTVEDALAQLGLPSTLEEYEEYINTEGEINNGVNERIMFEAITTLYSNQSMIDRGIPMAPANQRKLEMLENHPYFKRGEGDETTRFFGKKLSNPALTPLQLIRAKRANNVGKDNIGIIVNINKVFTLLNKSNAFITSEEDKIYYDGRTYDSFGSVVAEDDLRIIDYLSTLISAATDEAKDSNNAKFGIGVDQMKVAGILLGLGMPLADIILIINQPIIKAYTGLLQGKNYAIRTRAEKDAPFGGEIERAFEIIGATNEDVDMIELNPTVLSDILFNEKGNNFSAQQSAALKLFLQTLKLNEITSAVASVMKLTNGIDYTSIDNINRAKKTLSLDHPKTAEIIQGIRYALTGDPKYIGNNSYVNQLAAQNLRNLEEIEKLNNTTFLTNQPAFKSIIKELGSVYNYANSEDRKQFEKDALSYLTLATYKSFFYNGDNVNPNFRSGFIYDVRDEKSIVDNFAYLKNKIATDPDYADLKTNILIGQVGQLLAKSAKQKIKGKNRPSKRLEINEIITRTSSKKNELQQGEMTLSFLELLEDERTENFAKSLLDYELLKDGLQFQFQTIGNIFPVEMYNDALGYENSAISFVRKFISADTQTQYQELLDELELMNYNVNGVHLDKNNKESRNKISKILFGKEYRDFIGDFYKLKFTHVKSFKKIRNITLDKNVLVAKSTPLKLDLKKRTLDISIFSGTVEGNKDRNRDIIKSNVSKIKNAKFIDGNGDIHFPRYFKSYLDISGIKGNFLFEYVEDQKLRKELEQYEEDLRDLRSDYDEYTDFKIFDDADLQDLKTEVTDNIKAIKKELSQKATYKIVKVVGSPKVAPWLNPEGGIPTATVYKDQERSLNRFTPVEEVIQESEPVKTENDIVDLVLPGFDPKEVEETPKGAIESSLDQETKDIVNIGSTQLNYGFNIDEIIKKNKC